MYFVQPYGFEHPVGFSSSSGSSQGLYTVAADRLISVNGQDTTNMTWIQILKLFSNRPLNCRFERDPRAALEAGRASPGLEGEKKRKKKRDKKREEE